MAERSVARPVQSGEAIMIVERKVKEEVFVTELDRARKRLADYQLADMPVYRRVPLTKFTQLELIKMVDTLLTARERRMGTA